MVGVGWREEEEVLSTDSTAWFESVLGLVVTLLPIIYPHVVVMISSSSIPPTELIVISSIISTGFV